MTSEEPTKAVVLLSGGLDSATVLAIARDDGHELYALSFRYGQRHEHELLAAQRVADQITVADHVIADIDLRAWGGSALTSDVDVPKGCDLENEGDIPITYVPARNMIFLSFAVAWAETLEARHLYIGANALDYSGYPDCRPEFMAAFQEMARLGTRAGVEGGGPIIRAPLMKMTKADIIRRGTDLGVDYGLTHSCYDPTPAGEACGQCDSCRLRAKGFEQAKIQDPTSYAK